MNFTEAVNLAKKGDEAYMSRHIQRHYMWPSNM